MASRSARASSKFGSVAGAAASIRSKSRLNSAPPVEDRGLAPHEELLHLVAAKGSQRALDRGRDQGSLRAQGSRPTGPRTPPTERPATSSTTPSVRPQRAGRFVLPSQWGGGLGKSCLTIWDQAAPKVNAVTLAAGAREIPYRTRGRPRPGNHEAAFSPVPQGRPLVV